MRGSLVLKELKISLEELLEYGRLLKTDLSDPKADISEELFEKIRALHQNQITRERVFEIAMQNKARKIGAFWSGQSYKLPAKIKWFGNQSTGGYYGFLEVPELGDVFFHLDDVSGLSRNELRPDKFVLLELSKNDFEISRKKSAGLVTSLEDEKDVYFMLHCFSRIFRSAIGDLRSYSEAADTILEQFHKNLNELKLKLSNKEREFFVNTVVQLLEEDYIPYKINGHFGRLLAVFESEGFEPDKVAEIDRITQNYILKHRYNFLEFNFVLTFRRFCGLKTGWDLDEYIRGLAPKDDLYYWWSIQELNVEVLDILDTIAEKLNEAPLDQKRNLTRLSGEKVDKVINISFENILKDTENEYSLEQVGDFISLSLDLQKDLDLSLLGSEKLYQLWYNGYIEYFPVNAVRKQIVIYDIAAKKSRVKPRAGGSDLELLFKKLTEQETKDLIASYFYKSKLNDKDHFQELLIILDHIKEDGLFSHLKTQVFQNLSDYYKLRFFIADYTNEFRFDEAIIYTGLLEANEQKLFFKKVIKLIEEEKLNLGLEDLNRITTIDYQTSEFAKEIDGVGLDYTLSVILQLLNDLLKGEITESKTIYELIAGQVKKPDDLLVIDGFFDQCEGRVVLKPVESNSKTENGGGFDLVKDAKRNPRFASFCDGRKALNRRTGEPSECERSGKEFWWCENAHCYEISRKKHGPEDWRKYSLADVMRILGISYQDEQYEKLLAVINRVNRFLSHMTCRSCNTILRPVNSENNSNYAFYRVTRFQCCNAACEENEQEIYLSHCLNGRCLDIIDSRDSVRCKPEGAKQDCGWYICNNCFACCSTEKINGRKYIMDKTGQNYNCHHHGHKNEGKICCNKCGNEMKEKEQFGELYQKQLSWFIEHQEKGHPNIVKSGRRNDNKWWFRWSRGNYSHEQYRRQLKNMYYAGFNIPEFHLVENEIQLVAEPYRIDSSKRIFICEDCDNVINFNDLEEFDYARQRSIKYYHDRIFQKIRVTT